MIRNESELQEALRRLEGSKKSLADYRAKLEAEGMEPEQVQYAMGPSESFALQVREEIAQYQRMKRGDLDAIVNLHGLGPTLVAARIAAGVTQRQLAERLGVHESLISRDERNEYHGVTVERASRVLDALGVALTSSFARSASLKGVRKTRAAEARAAPTEAVPARGRSLVKRGKKKARRARVDQKQRARSSGS
jgi:transcriptional regulator with XRE-family HTH domain